MSGDEERLAEIKRRFVEEPADYTDWHMYAAVLLRLLAARDAEIAEQRQALAERDAAVAALAALREPTWFMIEQGRELQSIGDEDLSPDDMAAKWRAMYDAALPTFPARVRALLDQIARAPR